jgi:RHS repeat-associated protein
MNKSIKAQYNYYPFGKQWEDVNLMANTNRYTFSGKEKQTVRNLGFLDFGARMLDAEIGRWFVIDPLAEKYYSVSPYAYCMNNPLKYIDPNGEDIVLYGSGEYMLAVLQELLKLMKESKEGACQVQQAIQSEKTLVIFDPHYEVDHAEIKYGDGTYSTLGFDLSKVNGTYDESDGGVEHNAQTVLGHEISHFNSNMNMGDKLSVNNNISADEVHAVEVENRIRKDLGMQERTHYGGVNVYGKTIQQRKDGTYGLVKKDNYAQEYSGEVKSLTPNMENKQGFKQATYYRNGRFLNVRSRNNTGLYQQHWYVKNK